MRNIDDIIDSSDSAAAAFFAAELASGLKYVDKQTTNRPSQQPQANRLNPQEFLRNIPQPQRLPTPPSHHNDNVARGIIESKPINELLIPVPQPPTPIVSEQPKSQNNTTAVQLELPLNIHEKKPPTNISEWFGHLDNKLDELEIKNRIEIGKIYRLISEINAKLDELTSNRID
jgi:hypothetical protein